MSKPQASSLARISLGAFYLAAQLAYPSLSMANAKKPVAAWGANGKVQRYTNLDDDLFPILVTKPTTGGTTTDPFLPPPSTGGTTPIGPITGGTLPSLPSLPSLPGLPSGSFPGSFPGGSGSFPTGGGIFGDSSFGGYGTTEVPSEFSCPLFETNPYESIFRALDAMGSAMKITPACSGMNQSQQNQYYGSMQNNSDTLRTAVTTLRAIQANPDILQNTSSAELEGLIQSSVEAVNSISMNMASNPLLNNNQCGKASVGKTLLAANDILNSLAPVALVIAAANPAAGIAVKLALAGVSMAPAVISQVSQYIKNNTVDISNPEVRKAILKNTCQFMKVYQKINFLMFKEQNNLEAIRNTTSASVAQYKKKYQSISSSLLQGMTYKYDMEKALGELELRLAQDRANLNFLNAKIAALTSDPERLCFAGKNLVDNSRNAETFPASVVRNVELTLSALQSNNGGFNGFNNSGSSSSSTVLPGLPGSNSVIDDGQAPVENSQVQEAEELYLAYTKSRNRVAALTDIVVNSTDSAKVDKAIPVCASEVKNWAKRISDTINFLSKSVNSERGEVDTLLSVVPDYSGWNRDYQKVRSEKKTVSTVTKVLREMSKDNAVNIRTELTQRKNDMKNTLFNRTAGLLSKSPVEAWLQNNLDNHQNAMSQFLHFLRLLQKGAGQMTTTGGSKAMMLGMGYMDGGMAVSLNPQIWNDMATEVNLTNINLKLLPKGSRKHEIACQQLQLGILKYNEAKDFLGSAQFMCDMIDPIVSDTNSKLVQICRGSDTFNSEVKKSTIEQYMGKMLSRGASGKQKSMQDSMNLLKQRSKQLQCGDPLVNIID